MKRRDLVRILESNGYRLVREGDHSIYKAPGMPIVQVPKHKELNENTARKILKDAGLK